MRITVQRRARVAALSMALGSALLLAGSAVAQEPDRAVRAAHILVTPGDDPGAAMELDPQDPTWAIAEAEATVMAVELRLIADPAARADRFAELARTRSDDTGSGAGGGDLGAFTRDVMVPEFADPLFDTPDLIVGDILGPVRSDFGWHVILYQGEADLASPDPDPLGSPDPATTLTLDDPGAEPRTLLIFAPTLGSTATVVFTMATDSATTFGGGSPLETRQVVTMTWQSEVTDVAEASFRAELTLIDVTVDEVEGMGISPDDLRAQMEPMIGLVGWTATDASGKVIDSGVSIPDGLDPTIAQAFEQTIATFSMAPAALPAEPVGVGAVWTSTTFTPVTDLAPASTGSMITRLTAIDGSTITTEAASVASIQPGVMAYPGLPAGSEVLVLGGSSRSEAEGTLDLASLRMNTRGTSETTMRLSVDVDGNALEMTLVSRVEMTMRAE